MWSNISLPLWEGDVLKMPLIISGPKSQRGWVGRPNLACIKIRVSFAGGAPITSILESKPQCPPKSCSLCKQGCIVSFCSLPACLFFPLDWNVNQRLFDDAFVLCLHITKHGKVWAPVCQHRNPSLLTKNDHQHGSLQKDFHLLLPVQGFTHINMTSEVMFIRQHR